jgi:hypothetical protein
VVLLCTQAKKNALCLPARFFSEGAVTTGQAGSAARPLKKHGGARCTAFCVCGRGCHYRPSSAACPPKTTGLPTTGPVFCVWRGLIHSSKGERTAAASLHPAEIARPALMLGRAAHSGPCVEASRPKPRSAPKSPSAKGGGHIIGLTRF